MMDTVTYFMLMERVILGTYGIKQYREDTEYHTKFIEDPRYAIPLPYGDSIGMSCPSCKVGFRMRKKDVNGGFECPCCHKYFQNKITPKSA
jgi:hypothetical protein